MTSVLNWLSVALIPVCIYGVSVQNLTWYINIKTYMVYQYKKQIIFAIWHSGIQTQLQECQSMLDKYEKFLLSHKEKQNLPVSDGFLLGKVCTKLIVFVFLAAVHYLTFSHRCT